MTAVAKNPRLIDAIDTDSMPQRYPGFMYELFDEDDIRIIKEHLNVWKFTEFDTRYDDHYRKWQICCWKIASHDTSGMMYWDNFLPFKITVFWRANGSVSLQALLSSIDDSYYGIWMENKGVDSLDNALEMYAPIIKELKDWIDGESFLDGEDLWAMCELLGFDPKTKWRS